MRENNICENIFDFCNSLPRFTGIFLRLKFRCDVVYCLSLCEDVCLGALLKRQSHTIEEKSVGANHLRNLLVTLHSHSLKGEYSRNILSKKVVFQVKALVLHYHCRS